MYIYTHTYIYTHIYSCESVHKYIFAFPNMSQYTHLYLNMHPKHVCQHIYINMDRYEGPEHNISITQCHSVGII